MPSITTIVAVALVAVCWLVLLGGTAAVHDKDLCPVGRTCSGRFSQDEGMRPYWWGCWMEFFLLALNVVALVMDAADAWAMVLCSVSATATAYLMQQAEVWLLTIEKSFITSDQEDSATAAAAGAIMCCIANFILIILVGNSSFRGQATAKAGAAEAAVTAPA